jgi:hypothetical protein
MRHFWEIDFDPLKRFDKTDASKCTPLAKNALFNAYTVEISPANYSGRLQDEQVRASIGKKIIIDKSESIVSFTVLENPIPSTVKWCFMLLHAAALLAYQCL